MWPWRWQVRALHRDQSRGSCHIPQRVRRWFSVHASSMNFHDVVNLMGFLDGPWPRVPMSDGVGDVVSVGDRVTHVGIGDRVIGAFHPGWIDGRPPAKTSGRCRVTPGTVGCSSTSCSPRLA